jgi:hypothetical protein
MPTNPYKAGEPITKTMKTEMEQLKENADRQKAKETLSELSAYMDRLLTEMREQHALHMRSMKLEFATLGTSLLTIFAGGEILNALAFNLFIFTMFRNWAYIFPKVTKASHELDGCLETLRILGMLDKTDKRKRKTKRYRHSWIEVVWERSKQKKRQEAYA